MQDALDVMYFLCYNPNRKKTMKKTKLLPVLMVISMGAALLFGCGGDKDNTGGDGHPYNGSLSVANSPVQWSSLNILVYNTDTLPSTYLEYLQLGQALAAGLSSLPGKLAWSIYNGGPRSGNFLVVIMNLSDYTYKMAVVFFSNGNGVVDWNLMSDLSPPY
jgi:hypothetical protein